MSKTSEERIAEALASGIWKERVAPSGKKYYVNAKTKKSVWQTQFAKELEADEASKSKDIASPSSPAAGSTVLSKELREERLEKARRRQEEESQLNISIAQLERQKIKLENELSILQGPIEAEAAAIEDLKKQLSDQKQSVDTVAKEVAVRRKEKLAELQAMLAKVQKMESAKENEAAHQEAMRKRHAQLVSETQELQSDLLREQATAEALKQATRAAELKLGQANEELRILQGELERKRGILRGLDADVVLASKKKAEADQRLADLEKTAAELEKRVEKRRQLTYAQKELEKKRSGASDEMSMLIALMNKVEQRRRQLKELKQKAEVQENVLSLQTQNAKLKQLTADAARDKEQLGHLCKMLEQQTQLGTQLLAEYKARTIDLRHEVNSSLNPSAGGALYGEPSSPLRRVKSR